MRNIIKHLEIFFDKRSSEKFVELENNNMKYIELIRRISSLEKNIMLIMSNLAYCFILALMQKNKTNLLKYTVIFYF